MNIIKIFTSNWLAKLICIILSLIFWMYVLIGESKVDNFPGKIPLFIKNVPENLIGITDVEFVQIKISAERSIWNKLSANSFEAYVDLKNLETGTHELNVYVKSNVSGVEIVDINPAKVLVRLEDKISKKVPVKIQTEGQAGDDLVPGEAIIEPEEVEISGASSVINKTLEATALIQLNGETEQLEKTVPLIALDSTGEQIKGILFSPKEVKVILPIVKAGTSKTVGIKVKINGLPKSGYWISQIITNPAEVTVRGNSGILRSINFLETKNIDIEGINQNIIKNVELDVPSGVTLSNGVNLIRVELRVSQSTSEKEVAAGIIYDNIVSGMKVESIDPQTVKVLVSGPIELLTKLSSANVQIHLNLAGYYNSGSYSIDINRNMITVPEGLSISTYMPSAVRVNITNK